MYFILASAQAMPMASMISAVDNTLGSLFIGVGLAMILWGANSMQVYYYLDTFRKDALWLKLLVVVVWTLDTLHQAFITHASYVYLVSKYADFQYLGTFIDTLKWEVVVSALICVLVQGFLVWRVWRLTQNSSNTLRFGLVGLQAPLIGAAFVLSILYTAKVLHLNGIRGAASLTHLSRACNILSAVSDCALSLTLLYLILFRSHHSQVPASNTRERSSSFKLNRDLDVAAAAGWGFRGWSRSDPNGSRNKSISHRILVLIVSTGSITSLCALLAVITMIALPNTFIFIVFSVIISRFYTISMVTTLNARPPPACHAGAGASAQRLGNAAQQASNSGSGASEAISGGGACKGGGDFATVSKRMRSNTVTFAQQHMVTIKVETETTRDFYNDDIIKDQRGEFFDEEQDQDTVSVPYAYKTDPTGDAHKNAGEA